MMWEYCVPLKLRLKLTIKARATSRLGQVLFKFTFRASVDRGFLMLSGGKVLTLCHCVHTVMQPMRGTGICAHCPYQNLFQSVFFV